MSIKLGILALLEAKPERGDDLAGFLEQGRAIAASGEGPEIRPAKIVAVK